MENLSNILASQLEEVADRLRKGTSKVSKDTMLDCLEALSVEDNNQIMSKEEACRFMNMSRATFDTYIKMDLIPEGKKLLGFKELSWKKLDLIVAKLKLIEYKS